VASVDPLNVKAIEDPKGHGRKPHAADETPMKTKTDFSTKKNKRFF